MRARQNLSEEPGGCERRCDWKPVWQPLCPREAPCTAAEHQAAPLPGACLRGGGGTSTQGLAVPEASRGWGPSRCGTGRQTQQDGCHSHGAEGAAQHRLRACHSVCVMFRKRPSAGDSHLGVAWGAGADCRARGLPGGPAFSIPVVGGAQRHAPVPALHSRWASPC